MGSCLSHTTSGTTTESFSSLSPGSGEGVRWSTWVFKRVSVLSRENNLESTYMKLQYMSAYNDPNCPTTGQETLLHINNILQLINKLVRLELGSL